MKKYTLLMLLMFALSASAQKTKTRYFQAMYMGQDTTGNFRYGTYYWGTNNMQFLSRQEVQTMIVKDFKLQFREGDTAFSFIITEFKNRQEFDKFNRKWNFNLK